MIEISYFVIGVLIVSFFLSFFLTKRWITTAKTAGLTGKDMNKYGKKEVPEAGGVAFVLSFCFGVLLYVFSKTFIMGSETHLIEIFVLLVSMVLAGMLGFVDDILGWKIGLKQWQKPLLTLPIAIPLMVINAGHSSMSLPLLGSINLGLLYPLIVIPLGIMGAANGFNMLAGMNGLESGMGLIIIGTLGTSLFILEQYWLSLVCIVAFFSMLGFFVFNKYPSKVFPGDSLTYSVGALIAIVAILGNIEKIAVFLFALYFVEFFFKLKTKFKSECFGIPKKDGTLEAPKKIGSLTHLLLKIKKSEKLTVYTIMMIEIAVSVFVVITLL